MKAVVVNTCDIHKTYASFNLVGVFTNRKKLERVLRKLIKEGAIEINEGCPVKQVRGSLKNFTIDQMHNHIDYISVEEIELNEEQ